MAAETLFSQELQQQGRLPKGAGNMAQQLCSATKRLLLDETLACLQEILNTGRREHLYREAELEAEENFGAEENAGQCTCAHTPLSMTMAGTATKSMRLK